MSAIVQAVGPLLGSVPFAGQGLPLAIAHVIDLLLMECRRGCLQVNAWQACVAHQCSPLCLLTCLLLLTVDFIFISLHTLLADNSAMVRCVLVQGWWPLWPYTFCGSSQLLLVANLSPHSQSDVLAHIICSVALVIALVSYRWVDFLAFSFVGYYV